MIKSKEDKPEAIEIDLTGPDGNAFVLLGIASDFARQLQFDDRETQQLLDDMQSGDYDHLVEVFDKRFGHFVTLWR